MVDWAITYVENTAYEFHRIVVVGYINDYDGYQQQARRTVDLSFAATDLDFEANKVLHFSGVLTGSYQNYDWTNYPPTYTTFTVDYSVPWSLTINVRDVADDWTGDDAANVYATNIGHDILRGLGGDDVLSAGVGNDRIEGGAGDDTLIGGAGRDTLDGGSGFDTVDYSYRGLQRVVIDLGLVGPQGPEADTLIDIENVIGTQANDILTGNGRNNTFWGRGGNDTLFGRTGDDTLEGEDGADKLYGERGNDILRGGAGADLLSGGADDDVIDGGADIDTATYIDATGGVAVDLAVTTQQDTGGAGRDTVLRVENLTGSNHADTLGGDGLDNIIYGENGGDTLLGRGGDDRLFGGAGDDRLEGGAGADLLDGDAGANVYLGGAGNDTYIVDSAGDTMFETPTTNPGDTIDSGGVDVVSSSVAVDLDAYAGVRFIEKLVLRGTADIDGTGNALNNIIVGNDGANVLRGGLGADTLVGGAGNDKLHGGEGSDRMTGGAGNDEFHFEHLPSRANVDQIFDFAGWEDAIILENAVFSAFGYTGILDWGAFNVGAAATQADDRIVYNRDTGRLIYAASATFGAAGVSFATLQPSLIISAANFIIV